MININMEIEMSGKVHVAVRVRPLNVKEEN